MSELTTTYTNLLTESVKEAKHNRIPETESTPQIILGNSDGVLLVGVLKKDGIYHFYPVESPQSTLEQDSQAGIGGVSSQGTNTFLPYIVICIVAYLLFFNKK